MKFIYRRFAILLCICALALPACSSNSAPGGGFQTTPSDAAQSVIAASSYVRLMAETSAYANVGGFKITSPTFTNNGIVPKSMIGIAVPQCNGGNLSPVLNWSGQPAGTKSLALVLFDETANFGHWGIYNMRSFANRLPQGVKPGNLAGLWSQVVDDAGVQGYFGPCPPPGIVHHYVFTIYALDTTLKLQNNPPLPPPNIESLLYAMIGHVIGRASITGLLQKT